RIPRRVVPPVVAGARAVPQNRHDRRNPDGDRRGFQSHRRDLLRDLHRRYHSLAAWSREGRGAPAGLLRPTRPAMAGPGTSTLTPSPAISGSSSTMSIRPYGWIANSA